MDELTAASFELGSCQATVFTPAGDLSVSKVLKDVYPSLSSPFDGEPTVLPPVPEGAPPEIPRIILESKSHEWRCEFSPARVNVYWRRPRSTASLVSLGNVFAECIKPLLLYANQLNPRIARLAALTTRFAAHATPGLYLARHFCKDRWDRAPLNRPENFELHAHKRFTLASDFPVNSWARSKTGRLSRDGDEKQVVLFEQDLNTLAEREPDADYGGEDIKKFFIAAGDELNSIVELYFPDK